MTAATPIRATRTRPLGAGVEHSTTLVSADELVDACARQATGGARLFTVVATDERAHDGAFHLRYLFATARREARPVRIAAIELRLDPAAPGFPSFPGPRLRPRARRTCSPRPTRSAIRSR